MCSAGSRHGLPRGSTRRPGTPCGECGSPRGRRGHERTDGPQECTRPNRPDEPGVAGERRPRECRLKSKWPRPCLRPDDQRLDDAKQDAGGCRILQAEPHPAFGATRRKRFQQLNPKAGRAPDEPASPEGSQKPGCRVAGRPPAARPGARRTRRTRRRIGTCHPGLRVAPDKEQPADVHSKRASSWLCCRVQFEIDPNRNRQHGRRARREDQ